MHSTDQVPLSTVILGLACMVGAFTIVLAVLAFYVHELHTGVVNQYRRLRADHDQLVDLIQKRLFDNDADWWKHGPHPEEETE